MDVRTRGGEGCIVGPEGAIESCAFAISGAEMVDFVQVFRIAEVDFIGGNANDGACYVSYFAIHLASIGSSIYRIVHAVHSHADTVGLRLDYAKMNRNRMLWQAPVRGCQPEDAGRADRIPPRQHGRQWHRQRSPLRTKNGLQRAAELPMEQNA